MMKISFTKFYFYVSVITCLLASIESIFAQSSCTNKDDTIILLPVSIDYDVEMTFHVLRDLRHKIEHLPPDDHNSDLMVHVIIIFIEMYQKIVEATVTHYLLPNISAKQNLHDVIVKIIADDTLRLIALLCREFIHFIFDHKMTWQEKMCHCAWVVSVILIIKMGVENLPKSTKPTGIIEDITNKNEGKPFWPQGKTDFPY